RRGRLWFAATDYLLELDGKTWKSYRMPRGLRTHNVQTESLQVGENGHILIKAMNQEQVEVVLDFDPERGSFLAVLHPEGRRVQVIVPRRAGGFWAASVVPHTPGFRVEIFRNGRFTRYLDAGSEWKGSDLRCLLESSDGGIWVGGTGHGNAYRDGHPWYPFE